MNVENEVGHSDAERVSDGVGKKERDVKGWMARKSWGPGDDVGSGAGHSGGMAGGLRRSSGQSRGAKRSRRRAPMSKK